MQNPVVLLNGYGLAFFHCIPFFFRELAELGALSQKNMPLGCAKACPHTGFIAPLLPNPPRALEGVADVGWRKRVLGHPRMAQIDANGGALTKAGGRFSAGKRAGFQGAAVVDP